MTKILFICHGNICRSIMAQCILQQMVNRGALAERVEIDSAAVSAEELGRSIYPPARQKLTENGIACLPHRARLITPADYSRFDLLIGMDEENMRGMRRVFSGDPQKKCHLLLEFAGKSRAVADPWYTGNFDAAYNDLLEGCRALLARLQEECT